MISHNSQHYHHNIALHAPAAHGGAQAAVELDDHQLVQHVPHLLGAGAGQAAVRLDLG